MSEREYHLAAGFGTLLVTAALTASVTILHAGRIIETGPNLAEMESIEASLAYKKSDPKKKQPQKKFRAPVPEEKPDGVSHDETKVPLEPDKKEDPKRKPDENFEDQYKKFQRQDEDLQAGKPNEDEVGAFDGSEIGWADESKGDPFFQKLIADARQGWEYPEILKGTGVPVGCVHVLADGRIEETKLHVKSGDDALDDSVERALTTLKKLRNAEPQPVPSHLLRLTGKCTCIRFTL